jgi:hypothetical protein
MWQLNLNAQAKVRKEVLDYTAFKVDQSSWLWARVARWYIFKPKFQIWVNFGGSCYVKVLVF